MSETISLNVLADMRLVITPTDIARDGEHNSALFKIVQQPASLDLLACRAEIQTAQGTTYRLVTDGAFSVTNDFTVPGPGKLQLVYSDGTSATRKTTVADFRVTGSLNAVDEGNPDFQDGLAQLQAQAFARAQGNNDGIVFYNISGQGVDNVIYPPAQGGGDLTEDRANTLYLRLSGVLPMQGSVGISGPNRGITWEDSGRQGALYSTGTQLVLRLPEGDPPFVIEPNSGAAGLRSPVLTQQAADGRYLTPGVADAHYLMVAGGQMQGPLITTTGSGLTNPGLGIGDNATGFYRTGTTLLLSVGGALYTQWLGSPPSVMLTVPLNMATQQITNVGNPDAAAAGNSMAMPRSYADTRYVGLVAGGVVQGVLQIQQTPILPPDAVNKAYADALPKPNSRTYLTNTVDLTNTDQVLLDVPFPVPNNNNRTLTVTVFPSFSGGTPSQFYDLIYTINLAVGIEARTTVYPTAAAFMFSPVRFAATVPGNNNQIQVQVSVRLNAPGTGTLTITGSGTDKRSYVTIEEQQN